MCDCIQEMSCAPLKSHVFDELFGEKIETLACVASHIGGMGGIGVSASSASETLTRHTSESEWGPQSCFETPRDSNTLRVCVSRVLKHRHISSGAHHIKIGAVGHPL